jgi:hypothetical protein
VAPALRHVEQVALLARGFVRDVFHEQQDEDIILVLRGIHAAAQFIAGLPEGGVEFGFFKRHESIKAPFERVVESFMTVSHTNADSLRIVGRTQSFAMAKRLRVEAA